MSYSKHTWIDGETITQELLNNIENGIANNDTVIQSKGKANGIALLDSSGKIPLSQLPDIIPTSEKGVAGGVATLDSTGKIPTSQLPDLNSSETQIKEYTVSKKDGCQTAYIGTRLIMQGNIVFVEIDMTFASNVATNTAIEIANVGKMPPGKVVILNTVTNQGKSCYINIATDGIVTVVAIDSITKEDGIRTAITYFMGY